ncbi:MAG: 16S rRNA (cytosine(1402)-N(4))-methyltransferase RsmH [bacterium]
MHLPVMAGEVVELLITDPCGAYLDLTVGTGGHLEALAHSLAAEARLYGIDKDKQALSLAEKKLKSCRQRTELVCGSYDEAVTVMKKNPDVFFDGMLMDLGLSSLQLDETERGFSFRSDGPLDMRFDPQLGGRTAADLLRTATARELTEIIKTYGEQRQAAKIANAIVRERQEKMILTTLQLKDIIIGVIPPPFQNKACARVFQALRIVVNDELSTLQRALPELLNMLKVNGRLAVITYHSLEDRIVKRFFQIEVKGCTCPPDMPICVCGNKPRLKLINRKPILPQDSEIEKNPRARSAKLRVAERIAL